jgi:GNAT superfamily N-acetyltransferase
MPIDQLTRSDEAEAVASLASAFSSYPLFPHLCPDLQRRPRVIEAFCRMLFRMSAATGGAFATPCRSAVACALPPGSEWPAELTYLRSGLPGLLWLLGWRGGWWFARLGPDFDRARLGRMGRQPHWYLHLLGVRPEMQGKGLSRTVLEPLFAIARDQCVPIYLETMTEANVTIYQKLGFDLFGSTELTGGLPNWEMAWFPK